MGKRASTFDVHTFHLQRGRLSLYTVESMIHGIYQTPPPNLRVL